MSIVLLVGIILLLITFILFLRSFLIMRSGATAEGTVVGLIEDSEDGGMFAPIVRFSAAGGETVEFRHPVYQNPPYRIGDRLKVIYYESRPEKARVKSFTSLYMVPFVLGISSAVFFFVFLSVSYLEGYQSDTLNVLPKRPAVEVPRREIRR